MERKKKTWQQAFKHIIVSFQQKIEYFVKLRPRLAKKEKKLNALQKTLESHVDSRTSTEKIIQRQLHAEIEKRKQSEQKVEDALEYANGIISTVRNPLIVLDAGLRVISASRSFYKTFKAECKNTEGQHIYELGNRQWDIPKLRELLEDILPDKISFDNFEVEHHFPGIGKRTMILDARKINRKIDKRQLILLSIEDITRRKEAEEKIKDLASHDGLTGCVNFKSTMELLEKEIARSKRHHKKVSIIMIDIDQFKQINDEHSHLAGNDALVTFASIIKKNIRNIDIVGRYGGDEFIIILPESDSQPAFVVLDRIRHDFNQKKITSPHAKNESELKLKFSAGIAVFPNNASDLKELIWVADSALRQAKREGKNKSVSERRRMIRLNPTSGTKIEMIDPSKKENVKALEIANISKRGMLLLSTEDILDKELLCRIYRPRGEASFELTCKVMRKEKAEGELYRVGVYFPEVSEDIQKELSSCIESPEELD